MKLSDALSHARWPVEAQGRLAMAHLGSAGARRSAISAEGLSKEYPGRGRGGGRGVNALAQASFDVREGEFVAVVGPSGCGKSTLLKILAGVLPASGGSARLRGTPINGPRRDIGVVFQSPVLLPWRSVLENVLLPLDVQRAGTAGHATLALELLDLVGLREFAHCHPRELSGGMQQRVAITRALIHDPAAPLLDSRALAFERDARCISAATSR